MKKIFISAVSLCAAVCSYAQSNVYREILGADNATIFSNFIYNTNSYAYLSHPAFKVSAIAPTDNALMSFLDPVSYGGEKLKVWELHLDTSKPSSRQIYADVYDYYTSDADGNLIKDESVAPTQVTGGADNAIIKNRLEFMFKNSVIPGVCRPGKKYYATMGNNFVRIEQSGNSYVAYGSMQDNIGKPVTLTVKETENGTVMYADKSLLTSNRSVAYTLSIHPEFSEFLKVLEACGALSPTNEADGWQAGDQNYGNMLNIKFAGNVGAEDMRTGRKVTYLLGDGNYTIYAPTNEAMQMAYQAGLPTLAMLEAAEMEDEQNDIWWPGPESKAATIREVLLNFVKYHIQDHSVFVDEGFESGKYTTAKFKILENTTGDNIGYYRVAPPYKLTVKVNPSAMQITDAMGNTRNVITSGNLYNIMANEYWYQSNNRVANPNTVQLNNAPFAVIHAIDGPLFYNTSEQFTYQYHKIMEE